MDYFGTYIKQEMLRIKISDNRLNTMLNGKIIQTRTNIHRSFIQTKLLGGPIVFGLQMSCICSLRKPSKYGLKRCYTSCLGVKCEFPEVAYRCGIVSNSKFWINFIFHYVNCNLCLYRLI
jgi:hypothetical protein